MSIVQVYAIVGFSISIGLSLIAAFGLGMKESVEEEDWIYPMLALFWPLSILIAVVLGIYFLPFKLGEYVRNKLVQLKELQEAYNKLDLIADHRQFTATQLHRLCYTILNKAYKKRLTNKQVSKYKDKIKEVLSE